MTNKAPKFFKDDFADLKPISTLINEGVAPDGCSWKMVVVVDVFRQETYYEVYRKETSKVAERVSKLYNLVPSLQVFRHGVMGN